MSETKAAFAEKYALPLHGRLWIQVRSKIVLVRDNREYQKNMLERRDTKIVTNSDCCPFCTASHYENKKTGA